MQWNGYRGHRNELPKKKYFFTVKMWLKYFPPVVSSFTISAEVPQ